MTSLARAPPDTTIVVFDNDLLITDVVCVILKTEGYRVRAYDDAAVGRDAALAEPPRLVILDWRLAGALTGAAILN